MDDKNVIASAISDNELARAFSELVADRWDNWDLSEFLPYLVDTVAPSVLPYLADQFDIDGLQGFGMAETEQQQRDIIKKSIALHKFIGTRGRYVRHAARWGSRSSFWRRESPPSLAAPRVPRTGARFRVFVEAPDSRHITAEESRKIRLFVEFYKNERSHLVEIGYYQRIERSTIYLNSNDWLYIDATTRPRAFSAGFNHGFK